MQALPIIEKKTVIAKTRIFTIEQVDLQFSNGMRRQYERNHIQGQGSVLVLPMIDAETLLLVREYAVGAEHYELGFVKGLMHPNESLLAAANREMMEEIGYGANALQVLRKMASSPGYVNHVTTVILAQDLYTKCLPGDEPEAIEIVKWPLAQLSSLLQRDDVTDSKTLGALYLLQQHFKHNKE